MILAIDTGGTKTLVVGLREDESVIDEVKYPTPRDRDEYVEVLARTARERFGTESIEMVVVGTPGVIEDGVIVSYDKIDWSGFAVVERLRAEFPGAEVYLENDTKLAALGVMGEVEANRVMYLTLSTGIGAGMVSDGRLMEDVRRMEIGKITLMKDGRAMLWEHFASGSAFYEKHGRLSAEIDDPEVWREYAEDVSLGLVATIGALQPEAIVIGGSMGNCFEKYGEFLREAVRRDVFEWWRDVEIVAARNPDRTVIDGCYEYAKLRQADK